MGHVSFFPSLANLIRTGWFQPRYTCLAGSLAIRLLAITAWGEEGAPGPHRGALINYFDISVTLRKTAFKIQDQVALVFFRRC